MNFLGLDLSLTATGFYLIREDDKHVFMEIKTKPNDFPHTIARADFIAQKIIETIKDFKIHLITMEDYFSGRQPNSVIQLAILGTMVRSRLLDAGYSFLAVAPTQIKKFETGKGVAPKDNMLKSVFKNHDFDTNSNNVADACAIAYVGKAYYEYVNGGKRDFKKYELEVLKKIVQDRELTKPYKLER